MDHGSATISYALQSTKWYYKKAANEMGLHQKEPLFLSLWGAWLLTGSLFYAYAPDFELGIIKGFYMAINIGYSIGFGYPVDANSKSIWFSTIYVLIGASFVGVALGFFAERITQDSETWFSRLQDQKKIEDFILLGNQSWQGKVRAWVYSQRSALKAVMLWLMFVVALIIVSVYGVGWSFKEAQYFAISTLSTGGHWMIPVDSPDWLFAATGILTAFGVPIMAQTCSAVGQALMDQGSLEEAKSAINDPVTKEELQMLEDLGLQDGDDRIDQSEFILLCMVRIGTDPGLLNCIRQRFKELCVENADYLTIEEVTQNACTFVDGSVRRRASVEAMEQPPSALVLEEDEDDSSEDGSDEGAKNEVELFSTAKHNRSRIPCDTTSPPTETEASDIEEGELKAKLNTDLDAPLASAPTISAHSTQDQHASHQLTRSTVLQPQYDTAQQSARPLKRSDDMGMALLDRSYVMTPTEQKHLLREARRRANVALETAYHEDGWSSKGRIAGVKVSTKEGINGSPQNMVKGVTDVIDGFSYDFASSQVKYDARDEDSWSRFYKLLDPLCIQTTIASSIRSSDLLDEGAREQCGIFWAAVKAPLGVVRDRDVCVVVHTHRGQCPVTGEPVFMSNIFSVMHSSVPDMERALDRVRGEAMASYIIRPSPNNKEHYQLTYMIQYDPKGTVPVSVVNAFGLSQGLNAGRYRDVIAKQYEMALKLNNATSPVGCYDMKRIGRAVHKLQIRTEEEESLWDLKSTRTFKFAVCVHAQYPLIMRIETKGDDGMPLPYTLTRSEKSDYIGKNLAAGNSVPFGVKGDQLFSTTLLITVDGPLPKTLTLRFQNAFWRQNTIYVPALSILKPAETPDFSNTSSSVK